MTNKELFSFRKCTGRISVPLYKYFGNLDYAKDSIIHKRIHLEPPTEYNDVYDSSFYLTEHTLKRMCNTSKNMCNMVMPLVNPKYHDALRTCQSEVFLPQFSVYDAIEYICSSDASFSKDELIEQCIQGITHGNLLQAANNKISCFSEKNNSALMWAYYANCARGICLGFDMQTDSFLSEHCHKVQYSNKYIFDSNNFDNYFRKSEEWSHEQEWRIVCDTTEDYLPTDSLTMLILGYKMPQERFMEFVSLGVQYGLSVYRMRPSPDRYELLIEPILLNGSQEGDNK